MTYLVKSSLQLNLKPNELNINLSSGSGLTCGELIKDSFSKVLFWRVETTWKQDQQSHH